MPTCCVSGCTYRTYDKPDAQLKREEQLKRRLSFHRFPRDPVRKKQWLEGIERPDWTPNSNSVVCSEHFEDSYFDRSSFALMRLRRNAIPSKLKQEHKSSVLNFTHSILSEPTVLEISFDEDSIDSSDYFDSNVLKQDIVNNKTKKKRTRMSEKNTLRNNTYYQHKIRMLQDELESKKKKVKRLQNILSDLQSNDYKSVQKKLTNGRRVNI